MLGGAQPGRATPWMRYLWIQVAPLPLIGSPEMFQVWPPWWTLVVPPPPHDPGVTGSEFAMNTGAEPGGLSSSINVQVCCNVVEVDASLHWVPLSHSINL